MNLGTATPHLAAYMLFRKNGKIAFVLRQNTSWMNGYYGVPAGKAEKGESALSAAIRETKEEAGVDITAANLRHIMTGDRHDEIDWIDIWFEVTDWQGDLHNAEPQSHAELAWLDPNDLPDNVIPSVRFYIEQIVAGNTYARYGWNE